MCGVLLPHPHTLLSYAVAVRHRAGFVCVPDPVYDHILIRWIDQPGDCLAAEWLTALVFLAEVKHFQ
jgi:hypothetical protein